MPLLTLDRLSMAFGHLPLLDETSLQVEPRERVCVLGRNGSGKSTLLRILNGEQLPDAGTVLRQPILRVARLDKDVPLAAHLPVFDVVARGLGGLSDLVMAYHHAAVAVAEPATAPALERLAQGRARTAVEQVVHTGRADHLHDGFLLRVVDVLALAGLVAMDERRDDGEGSEDAGPSEH